LAPQDLPPIAGPAMPDTGAMATPPASRPLDSAPFPPEAERLADDPRESTSAAAPEPPALHDPWAPWDWPGTPPPAPAADATASTSAEPEAGTPEPVAPPIGDRSPPAAASAQPSSESPRHPATDPFWDLALRHRRPIPEGPDEAAIAPLPGTAPPEPPAGER
jgi:hypothetical protein